MRILAIDPGPETSGWCVYDTEERRVLASGTGTDNRALLVIISEQRYGRPALPEFAFEALAIEDFEYQRRSAGREAFVTNKWIGRFEQEWYRGVAPHGAVYEVIRGDVKTVLCGAHSYTDPDTKRQRAVDDPEIRAAVIGLHKPTGGGSRPQIGVKKQKGPLYGVAGHAWDAVAVAVVLTQMIVSGRGNEFRVKDE
jgi:hypothetical protein